MALASCLIGCQIPKIPLSSVASPLAAVARRRYSIPPPLLFSLDSSTYQSSCRRWRSSGVMAQAKDEGKSNFSSLPSRQQPESDDDEETMDGSGMCDPLCSVDDVSSQDFEASYQPKTDLLKALTILVTAVAGAIAINHSWVAANQDLAMALVFALGYGGIIFEESLAFNKSGVGLLMAVCLWVIRSIG